MTNDDSFLTGSAGAVSKEALDRVIAAHKAGGYIDNNVKQAIPPRSGEHLLACNPIDHEKLAFIREAAMRLYVHKDCDACDAWRKAKWLWNEKPEDC